MREVEGREVDESRFAGDAEAFPVLAVALRIFSLRFAFLTARVFFVVAKSDRKGYSLRLMGGSSEGLTFGVSLAWSD